MEGIHEVPGNDCINADRSLYFDQLERYRLRVSRGTGHHVLSVVIAPYLRLSPRHWRADAKDSCIRGGNGIIRIDPPEKLKRSGVSQNDFGSDGRD